MKIRCPSCKGPATKLADNQPGRRYRCDQCGALCRFSDTEVILYWVLSVALVLGALYAASKQGYLQRLPSYSGYAIGLAILPLQEWLLARLGRPKLYASASAPDATVVAIPFMRAIGAESIFFALLPLSILCAVPFVLMFIETRGEFGWATLLIPVAVLAMTIGGLFEQRCPSCRRRLLAQPIREWHKIFSIQECPHCSFRPPIEVAATQERRSGLRRLGFIAICLILVVPSVMRFWRGGIGKPALPPLSQTSDHQAPLDWRVQDLEGREIDGASFRGKVLFLNLWATWCLPCRTELASITKLYDAVGSEVAFACISNEPLETLRQFVSERDLHVPIYKIDETQGEVFKDIIYPTTYVVDAGGHDRFKQVGAADWGGEETISYLKALVAEGTEMLPRTAAGAHNEGEPSP